MIMLYNEISAIVDPDSVCVCLDTQTGQSGQSLTKHRVYSNMGGG